MSVPTSWRYSRRVAHKRRHENDLAGIIRVLVDGSNQRGESQRPPDSEDAYARSLITMFPPHVDLVVVFDTDPPIGGATIRKVGRAHVVHARAGGGDDEIVHRVEVSPAGSLVISDDIELGWRVRERGGRVERNEWLRARQASGRRPASSVGQPRNPAPPASDDEHDDRPAWHPGRGATVKRGPSRKEAKRQPRRG